MLVEDDYDYTQHQDFVSLVEAHHGYPATIVQWQPAAAAGLGNQERELIATSGDALRVWEYSGEGGAAQGAGYVNVKQAGLGHKLTLKSTLSGVRVLNFLHFHFLLV